MVKFYIMFEDELVATVWLSNNSVNVKTYTNEYYKQPFTKQPVNIEYCKAFLERRVISETHEDANKALKELGLQKYDIINILRKTHGVDMDDFLWIRFDGDTVCWNDINPRLKLNKKLRAKQKI